jgi:hypothetical protein
MRAASQEHVRTLGSMRDTALSIVRMVDPAADDTYIPDWISDRAAKLASDLARDRDLAPAYRLARDLATAAARDLADFEDLGRGRLRLRRFSRDRTAALARRLASELDRAEAARGQGGAQGRGVAPSASRLLASAARWLPAADRTRYAEEYRSELWEIARAGAGRRTQLAYAVRQVMSAWRLRIELRAPQRRRAAP